MATPRFARLAPLLLATFLASAAAQEINSVAGNGVQAFAGDGGPATAASLAVPRGVAVDSDGNIYVADTNNHRIRKVAANGTITTYAGTGMPGFSGDGGNATNAQLLAPFGLALDAARNLFVADVGNNRIRRITSFGSISTVAGNGTPGFLGDGGAATAAQLSSPYGVATQSDGSLVIADSGNHRVRIVSPGGVIATLAGNGTAGFSGDGGPAIGAALNQPTGVAAHDGAVYIADYNNHRVRRVQGSAIATFAGTGVMGTSTDGTLAISASLNGPGTVAVDPASGIVHIAEAEGQRVRKVLATGAIQTVAGNGTTGYGGEGLIATATPLSTPFGLAIDSLGRVLIADSANQRVRRVGFTSAVPGAPVLDAVVPGDGKLTVRYFPPGSNGGSPILDYTAECAPGSQVGPGSPTPVTGLMNGVVHTCRVRARNALGDSPWSNVSLPVTPSDKAVFVSPPVLDIGTQAYGTPNATGVVTILDSGTAPLIIVGAALSGPDAANFSVSSTCPPFIQEGETCVFVVALDTQAIGQRTATLVINTLGTGSPHLVPVTGNVLPPSTALAFSPPALDLGTPYFGSPPVGMDVLVESTSLQAVTILGATLTGPDADAFVLTGTCPAVLASLGTCTYTVAMDTSRFGARSATLTILTNAPDSPHLVAISGNIPQVPYPLNIQRNGTGTGSVASTPGGIDCGLGISCQADFLAGTSITLQATPFAGAVFTSWSNAPGCGTSPTCTFVHASPRVVTATFTLLPTHQLDADKRGAGTGTITSSPPGIHCGTDCVEFYPVGTVVTATATPDAGWAFTGWIGGTCGMNPSCTVTVTGAHTFTASFDAPPVPIVSLSITNANWSVAALGPQEPRNVVVSNVGNAPLLLGLPVITGAQAASFASTGCSNVTVVPGSLCLLVILFEPVATGSHQAMLALPTNDPLRPTMFVTLTASVVAPDYIVTVQVAGSGTVSFAPGSTTCGQPGCTASYPAGSVVTLTTSPAAGSTFAGWSGGGCTGTAPCVMPPLIGNATVQATFVAAPTIARTRGDFNGDGRSDIFWRDSTGGLNYQYQMNGLALSGQGYLPSVPSNWMPAGLGDVDGDGKADLLWREAGGLTYLWTLDGLAIATQGYLPSVPPEWTVAGLGDLDGDGRADVVWRKAATGENYAWLMNGATIAIQGFLPGVAGADWRITGLADYTGDGKADLFWRNAATGDNYLWVMNGLTIASQGYLPAVPAGWDVVGSPNADGNTTADVLWRNATTGENYLWLMNGLTVVNQGYLPTVADAAWKVVGFGDYDGDGRGDILWRNPSTGQNYVFLMNGLAVAAQGFLPSVSGTNWMPVK